MGLRARLTRRTRDWIRRRQGADAGPVTLRRGRIYILPTGLGGAFGLMLVGMLLGSLNYGNNLGLALTFLLAALAVVAMHACHRNLEALIVRARAPDPPFAGSDAAFGLALANPGRAPRFDIEAAAPDAAQAPVSVPATGEAALELRVPTRRRGSVVLDRPDPTAPVSDLFLFGRKQDVAFEKAAGRSARHRHHVRFWRWDEAGSDGRPLWIGSATFDESVGFSHTTGQITHHIAPDLDTERDALFASLAVAGLTLVQIGRTLDAEKEHLLAETRRVRSILRAALEVLAEGDQTEAEAAPEEETRSAPITPRLTDQSAGTDANRLAG